MMRTTASHLAALGLAFAAACSKAPDDSSSGSGGANPVATPRDAVLDAWKAAKLTPSAMAPETVGFAKDCQTGTISGIDVLVCNFASPADAKAAEDPGLGWVGGATGSSQAHGSALVVVVDRHKTDPNGRTINQLMKLAPN